LLQEMLKRDKEKAQVKPLQSTRPEPTVEELEKKYSNERTEEVVEYPRMKVTHIVFNKDGELSFYTKVVHNHGAVFYFKNGFGISAWQFDKETK